MNWYENQIPQFDHDIRSEFGGKIESSNDTIMTWGCALGLLGSMVLKQTT